MALAYGPGGVLYAAHNTTADVYNFKIARIDAASGAVLSDTVINSLTGTDYPIWNSLHYHEGALYAVENNSWGSGYTAGQQRGHTYQVALDGGGDPCSAVLGAYIGGAPDGGLTWRDGVWYASDWKTDSSSWIKTSTDIMATDFSASTATSPNGLISGWDFTDDGRWIGVSWYYTFDVYQIDPNSGAETVLYNLASQLPSNVTMYGALTVPEPATMSLLALGTLAVLRRRSR